jgi:hypothetical protein
MKDTPEISVVVPLQDGKIYWTDCKVHPDADITGF